MSLSLERLSALVADIYNAALDPGGFRRLMPVLSAALQTESCALQTRDLAVGTATVLGMTENFDSNFQAEYESHYHKEDLWVAGAAKVPIGRAAIGTDFVSEAELVASEFYNGWAKKQGAFHLLGAVMTVETQVVGVIGIHRPFGAKAYDMWDRKALDLMLPHLTRALQLHGRLDGLCRERIITLQAVETLAIGMIMVAADGRLLFANAKAERELRKGRGVTVRRGYLRATTRSGDDRLALLVRQAALAATGATTGSGGVLPVPLDEGGVLSLLVSPLPPGSVPIGSPQLTAMIFMGDPDDRSMASSQVLAKFYGLTPAEARLAAALLAGDRLESYAETSEISRETARTLLKRTFAKMGCSRQSDLIREALANPIVRVASQRVH